MITKMSLQNFKSFKNMDDLDIKPLTIIVGRNSCGKSSIIQSLLLLKQTLEAPRDVRLCLEGDYLKYTNLQELSFGLPDIEKANIAYNFQVESDNSNINGKINIKFSNKKKGNSYVPDIEKYSLDINGGNKRSIIPFDEEIIDTANSHIRYHREIHKNNYKDEITAGLYNFVFTHIELLFLHEDVHRIMHVGLNTLSKEIKLSALLKDSINNIKYLSPIRAAPQRDYIHYSQGISELGKDGFNSAHLLWSKQNQIVSWKGKQQKLSEAINQCMNCIGLSQAITPDKIGDIIYKVGVAEKNSGKPVSLADVGVGYSQIIPITLLGLLNNSENLMLIEQPEIHLHPSSAANLADLFLGFIEDNKLFIIETHSQDFINKLRLRVIQNPELKDKINIVFVEQNDQGESHIKQFEIDENGMFPEWPEGFIDESENLARETLKARLDRA